MKKFRVLSLALALTLCFSLTACGNNGGGKESSDPGSTGSASGDTIKVGLLGNTTGAAAQYGNAVFNGAKLYVEELNAAGGINGKTVELVEYDEEGDAAKAQTGYGSLVDSGVTAILGSVLTSPTVAVAPLADEDGMPMITASATATSVTYNEETNTVYGHMFRSCFIDPFQGSTMASFASAELGAKTAAILTNNGSAYSQGLTDAFVEKAAEVGLTIVAQETYAGDDTVDFQSQLTNIAAKNPDVLFVPDYYNIVALVAQQAASTGVKATLLGADGWDTVLNYVNDASVLENAYFCAGYSAKDDSEMVQAFLKSYEDKYGAEPDMFAAQAYDAAHILCDALKAAEDQGLETGSAEYKDAVTAAMKATDADFVTGHVTYDEYNNPQKTAAIINIKGGEYEFWGRY